MMARALKVATLVALLAVVVAMPARAETRYSLCVGIDQYFDISSLTSCVNDASSFYDRLANDDARWNSENMTLLPNTQATLASIRGWFSTMAGTAVSGDTLVYFHSSHGGQNSGTDTFICTYYGSQDYQDDYLAADLAALPAGVNVIIVIDTCNSAGMFKGLLGGLGGREDWPFVENVTAKLGAIKSALPPVGVGPAAAKTLASNIGWMTACDYYELSWAGWPYSLFAGYVIDGFSGAADTGPADGDLSFIELFNYAAPLANSDNPAQTPQSQETATGFVLTNTIAASTFATAAGGDDTFESGNFSSFAWQLSGNAPWTVVAGGAHAGTYSARSGTITHNQTTTLRANLTTGAGPVSFWWNTDTEQGYDHLTFYVDGVLKTMVSGWDVEFGGWQFASYDISAGAHTFTWTYTKDFMTSSGADCVWIDDIDFPLAPVAVIGHNGPQPTGTNVTFNGTSSTDADGTIALYEWDLDNDGSYDDATGVSGVTWSWPDDGTYTVGLQVTDDEGYTDTTTASVVITNQAPTAIGTHNYTVAIEVGESVIFNDNASTDPDGTVDEWVWDFDDGETARTVAADLPFDYAYSWTSVNSYDVTLTVIDDDNASSTVAAVVTVVVNAMTDADGDLLPDAWEATHFSLPTDTDGTIDSDGDGLNDMAEFLAHTDPNDTDTDGDGHSDSVEVASGSNPLDAESMPVPWGGGGGGGGGGCATGGGGPGWAAAMLMLFAALVGLRMKPKAAKVRRR